MFWLFTLLTFVVTVSIQQEVAVGLDGTAQLNEQVYFLPYGTMYEHKRMLSDRVRMVLTTLLYLSIYLPT